MNLKMAARRMGVHYQTVYRWVRSGELPAVRDSLGYEVSEEALTYFLARRDAPHAVRRDVDASGSDGPSWGGASELLDRLDEVLPHCGAVIDPLLTLAAQGVAHACDACCAIRLPDPDDPSGRLGAVAAWHPTPAGLGAWSQIVAARTDLTFDHPRVRAAFAAGVLVTDHMPFATLRDSVPPESRYLFDAVYPYSSMLAAIAGVGGRPIGLLAVARGSSGRLFRTEDRELAAAVARRLALAVERRDGWIAAASLRHRLFVAIGELLAGSTVDEARPAVVALVRAAPGVAFVLDDQARFVAVSEPLLERFGRPAGDFEGSALDVIQRPADVEDDRALFDRLWRGQLDHATVQRVRRTAAGEVDVDVHWSVVRSADARPAFLVATSSLRPQLADL